MPDRVIKRLALQQARVENDVWRVLGLQADEDLSKLPGGPILVPLAVWKAR